LNIAVKNDWFDLVYNAKSNVISADWLWLGCCTSGLAISNLPVASPFCVNVSVTPLIGTDQIYVASQNMFGEQDLQHIGPGKSTKLQLCGGTCINQCGNHATCDSCAADPSCGWCSESGTCEYGDATGPTTGYCGTWRFTNSTSISRVISSDINFPVSPSAVSVYLAPSR
jgi:hypothetical protein